MQPVIRHSFVSFPRNAKPKVSASFQECGDSDIWTILHQCIRRKKVYNVRARSGPILGLTNFWGGVKFVKSGGMRPQKLSRHIYFFQFYVICR